MLVYVGVSLLICVNVYIWKQFAACFLWPPIHSNGQAIIFCRCGFLFLSSSFFPCLFSAVTDWCLPYFHTWCGLSANLECRSKMCCTRLTEIPPHHHNRCMALFLGPPGWASARRELLDFMVQRKINRRRHTDHPAGHHSIRTNQCSHPPSPAFFYRPDALPAAQPTVSKHWRQLVHSD